MRMRMLHKQNGHHSTHADSISFFFEKKRQKKTNKILKCASGCNTNIGNLSNNCNLIEYLHLKKEKKKMEIRNETKKILYILC